MQVIGEQENHRQKAAAFTVGKIEEGLAILVSDELQLVEFPYACLPAGIEGPVGVGSVISLQIVHDSELEKARIDDMARIQDQILKNFGKSPTEEVIGGCLKGGRCAHTAVEVSWPSWKAIALEHGWRCDLRSLDCYVNDSLIKSRISPEETVMRLNNLEPGQTFALHLVFRTSSGTFKSNVQLLKTIQADDMSGLILQIVEDDEDIKDLAREIGAFTLSAEEAESADVVPSHLVVKSKENLPPDLQLKCQTFGIPIVTLEWLQACKDANSLQPINSSL